MTALLTRAACDRADITRTQLAAAFQCCLTRVRKGVYVITGECAVEDHGRLRAIAVPASLPRAADVDRPGLLGHVAKMCVLVDSYRDSLPQGSAFSHLSAGLMWGLPITRALQNRAEAIRPGHAITYRQLLVRNRELPDSDVANRDAICLTTAARTVIDVAHDYPLDMSVPMIDTALSTNIVTAEELVARLAGSTPRRGIRRARRALSIADPAHESPAESICAVRFHEHGIDGFVPQILFGSPDGAFRARVDFLHREAKVIVEVNGEVKYKDGDAGSLLARKERDRDYRLRNMGYRVYQLSWADLFGPRMFQEIRHTIRTTTPTS